MDADIQMYAAIRKQGNDKWALDYIDPMTLGHELKIAQHKAGQTNARHPEWAKTHPVQGYAVIRLHAERWVWQEINVLAKESSS